MYQAISILITDQPLLIIPLPNSIALTLGTMVSIINKIYLKNLYINYHSKLHEQHFFHMRIRI